MPRLAPAAPLVVARAARAARERRVPGQVAVVGGGGAYDRGVNTWEAKLLLSGGLCRDHRWNCRSYGIFDPCHAKMAKNHKHASFNNGFVSFCSRSCFVVARRR